jgi:hypothetical protein
VARIRTIKPELASSVKLARVTIPARFTFVLLISQSDDDGLQLGNPRQLLGALYPHDADLTAAMLEGWLRELATVGAIRRMQTPAGAAIIAIPGWTEHQNIDPTKRGLSLLLGQLVGAKLPKGSKEAADARAALAAGTLPAELYLPTEDPSRDPTEDPGRVPGPCARPWTGERGPGTNEQVTCIGEEGCKGETPENTATTARVARVASVTARRDSSTECAEDVLEAYPWLSTFAAAHLRVARARQGVFRGAKRLRNFAEAFEERVEQYGVKACVKAWIRSQQDFPASHFTPNYVVADGHWHRFYRAARKAA